MTAKVEPKPSQEALKAAQKVCARTMVPGKAPCTCTEIALALDAFAAEAVAREREEDWCDACAGSGTPVSALPCICGGTGRASQAFVNLRIETLALRSSHAELLWWVNGEHTECGSSACILCPMIARAKAL